MSPVEDMKKGWGVNLEAEVLYVGGLFLMI